MFSKLWPRARLAVTALALLLITACAATPPVPQNLKAETDDLAMVADWTLRIAADYGEDRVLAVFDIDNTLLAMEQGLGADQWYYWQKNRSAEDPCDPRVVDDLLAAQGALFFASAMRATQDDAGAQVRRLQQAGVPVIALTARGPSFRLQTFRELRRNGIDFRATALPPAAGWPEDFVPDNGVRPARYEDGVLLVAGQHKGKMLEALLDKTGVERPTVVVMIDDKMNNLDDVLEAFAGSDTWVHAWRYTREDPVVAAFDPDEAAAQWDALEPALKTLERVLGPDNFSLPGAAAGRDCPR
jgi:hypothetical protein